MIFLTTGNPTATVEAEQVAVEIPSGNTTVTIALDFHQAMMLANRTLVACKDAMNERRQRPTAEIIPFAKRARA